VVKTDLALSLKNNFLIMAAIDKSRIIEAIQQTEDERILFAINRLLQIEEDIPEWHKQELDKRTALINEGKDELYNWDDVKKEITSLDT
jgi:hypothetical protein